MVPTTVMIRAVNTNQRIIAGLPLAGGAHKCVISPSSGRKDISQARLGIGSFGAMYESWWSEFRLDRVHSFDIGEIVKDIGLHRRRSHVALVSCFDFSKCTTLVMHRGVAHPGYIATTLAANPKTSMSTQRQ